ncbi:MAG TPA: hypothetical protein VGR13_09090 [Actinomycetota bacterium]|jgi:hypothetical protein|nr:hypothetical protein [Actinomycetota bacterium]
MNAERFREINFMLTFHEDGKVAALPIPEVLEYLSVTLAGERGDDADPDRLLSIGVRLSVHPERLQITQGLLEWLGSSRSARSLERVSLVLRGLWTYGEPAADEAEQIVSALTHERSLTSTDETAEFEYVLTLCHFARWLRPGPMQSGVLTALQAAMERGFADEQYSRLARQAIEKAMKFLT